MRVQESRERRISPIAAALTWLGGGHWGELGERHERSTHAVAGVVVAVGAVVAWIVVSLAVGESARWPMAAIVALTLLVGLLVGAVTRGTASGPVRGWPGIAGRGMVAVGVGVVIGELAALVLFSGSIDRRLDERSARNAASAPAVAQASATLDQTRAARTTLDRAVDQARAHRDEALVVARCEYHPTQECPQTRITGVPGVGPETRTANELLADAQGELDNAVGARDSEGPGLDAKIAQDEQALAQARQSVIANSDRGLGARWVAMQDLTLASAGALMLRLIAIAFFSLLYLLPLILRLWRGETTHDRQAAARAERDRAEVEADTAIAIKRAEVRQAAEAMWAEQQLANARLAVDAQTEIDRAHHRRRVAEAVGGAQALTGPVKATSQRTFEPPDEMCDVFLPIAAEAEAASRARVQLPAAEPQVHVEEPQNLPAQVYQPDNLPVQPVQMVSAGAVEPRHERTAPLIPPIPDMADVTRAAARWIRPLVPPFVARAIDSTAHPLRAARQAFEEVEEITFLLRRTHKVTLDSESQEHQPLGFAVHDTQPDTTRIDRIESSREPQGQQDDRGLGAHAERSSLRRAPATDTEHLSLGPAATGQRPELMERDGPRELRSPDGPRQLPPGD